MTLEAVAGALYDGLQLATMLACVGAANALANPTPAAASRSPARSTRSGSRSSSRCSFAPQLVESVQRVRAARRLRGRPDRGLRGLRGVAMPVLEGALERSLELAAAMDSRGYGRGRGRPARSATVTGALTLAGLLGVCVGLLRPARRRVAGRARAARAGRRRGARGRRAGSSAAGVRPAAATAPTRGALPEWVVSASGVAAAAACSSQPPSTRRRWLRRRPRWRFPSCPSSPPLAVLVALLPAWVAPPPADAQDRSRRSAATRRGELPADVATDLAQPAGGRS